MPKRKNGCTWVVPGDNCLVCLRCGDVYQLKMPIDPDRLAEVTRAAVALHKDCLLTEDDGTERLIVSMRVRRDVPTGAMLRRKAQVALTSDTVQRELGVQGVVVEETRVLGMATG
jgi:hypothetical protein